MGAFLSRNENATERRSELLHSAITRDCLDDVKQLLESGVPPDILNTEGSTPLKTSLDHGQLAIADFLLEHGANINVKDKRGRTILFHTVLSRKPEYFNLILKYRPDVNLPDDDGWTPLHIATTFHDGVYFIKQLLDNGAVVDSASHKGITPLHTAIESRNPENVYEVLKYRPNVEMVEYRNIFHTLIRLLYYGNPMKKVVDYLLDYGFVASESDVKNSEFLRAAFSSEFYRLVEHLIQNGADINFNYVGKPLFIVACHRRLIRLVKLMINKGIDVETKVNALETAIQIGDKDLLELLLNSGVPKDLGRLLQISVRTCSADTLEYFLESEKPRFNVNSFFEGKTLAHLAAGKLDANIIKVLWKYGADFELRDLDGNTPLHIACSSGYGESVEALLRVDADINALNYQGQCPVDLLVDDYSNKPYVLRKHIAALLAAQLYVRDELISFLMIVNDKHILESYQQEIEVLKQVKIHETSVTLYRLLRCSQIEMSNFLKNEYIRNALSSIDFFSQFTIQYKDLFLTKIENGLRRKSLIESITKHQFSSIPFLRDLPAVCLDIILSNCSCEDLGIMNGFYRVREVF